MHQSSLIIDIGEGYEWIDDDIWNPYEESRDFLEEVYRDGKGKIPCKPVIKVIEDGLIVGILTETNQFVSIKDPVQDTYGDDLKSLNNSNFVIPDVKSLVSNRKDDERIEVINNIRLETSFYNTFRNTIKLLLGNDNHRVIGGRKLKI